MSSQDNGAVRPEIHRTLNQKQESPTSQPSFEKRKKEMQEKVDSQIHKLFTVTLPKYLNFLVLVLSFGLIAFISWDTYKERNFLDNPVYMEYQFIVCMIFIAEFIYRFLISRQRLKFLFFTIPFILISIPYLNLINYYNYYVPENILNYLRFIPVIRGLVALVVVVNFVSKNLTTTLFASYVLVLVPLVYMGGLFFYIAEKHINPGIKNFWYALWWAGMNVTTIGCDINPMTATGMIWGLVLSLLGIIMFPLFTVYLGDVIQSYNKKQPNRS